MGHINIEIKARTNNQDFIRNILKERKADFKGIDHQIDTYFNTSSGKLKYRQGNIENALVYYERENKTGPKQSKTHLFQTNDTQLRKLLKEALGVLVVVDKKREIYFIDNIKFHLDIVNNLGTFVEIEARDTEGTLGKDKLLKQCQEYLKAFDIKESDLIPISYSDLLLEKAEYGYRH